MASEESAAGRNAEGPAWLLRSGIVAGPFYLALGLGQALVRDGFDLGRHPLSLLASGPGGWVQTANFVLSGLMVLAAAAGIGRVLGRKARGVTWSLAVFGLGMLVAAAFPADPVDGFPPGTPEGFPTTISTTGLVHFVAGALGFVALGISGLRAAWVMRRRRMPTLALVSLLSGLGVLGGFFSGAVFPPGIIGIWIAVVVGWAWLAFMSFELGRSAARR